MGSHAQSDIAHDADSAKDYASGQAYYLARGGPATPLPISPSAERNKEPILTVLRKHLQPDSAALEIASGTGQHIAFFAQALPDIMWQPSERDEAAHELLQLRIRQLASVNIRPPLVIDVSDDTCPLSAEYDAVLCINMLHIAPWAATDGLFRVAKQVLRAGGGGLVITYGPYKENDRHTAPSNDAFDQSLRAQNPLWGVRDVSAVDEVAARRGFRRRELVRMPANNLMLIYAAPHAPIGEPRS
jgi:cyclopropane fatty-acyl-phospholipid synthase-like methyltransferase